MKEKLVEENYTLIGRDGLDNIEELLKLVKKNNIEGAFVETGVWQGGACIWARAVMDSLGIPDSVFVCDSFEGCPPPSHPLDAGDIHYKEKNLAVSLEKVQENFTSFNLKGSVKFIKGWFKDTMPHVKKEAPKISILRLDGDLYQSTIEVLDALYANVAKGGFVIIDDYCLGPARLATEEFRKKRRITSPLERVNGCIHFWQK